MKKWNYVEKDGNPTKAGVYWVTLIYPEWKEGQKTGKYIAEVDTRYFADLKKEPDCKEWIMSGQPEGDFAWTEQTGVEVAKRSMPGSQWKILVFLICQKE